MILRRLVQRRLAARVRERLACALLDSGREGVAMETHIQERGRRLEKRASEMIVRTRDRASNTLQRHPGITVAGACGLGLAAAVYLGTGPAAVAGGAAYFAYRWLNRSPGPLYRERESTA
jgi:hypothetical protein